PAIDAGNSGINARNSGINAGNSGIDAGNSGTDARGVWHRYLGAPPASQDDRIAQRLQIGHSVEIHVAVRVIDLVLKNAGREVLDLDVERIALVVETVQFHAAVTRRFDAEKRHAEAALPV